MSSSDNRPVVGIVVGIAPAWRGSGGNWTGYSSIIEGAGGRGVPLGSRRRHRLDECAGLLLPGGWDVHPRFYDRLPGDERLSTKQLLAKYDMQCEKLRDAAELRLICEAFERGIPILAICRGIQTLNVALARKLIPDIEKCIPGALCHHADQDGISANHEIEITPGSIIERCYGARKIVVNSRHHQGMTPDMVSKHLRVTAIAPDGVVEAVEAMEPGFVVGVQWHPERRKDAYIHDISGPLFQAFVTACASAGLPIRG